MTTGYTPEGFVFTATYDAENRLRSIEYTDADSHVQRRVYTYRWDNFLVRVQKFTDGTLVDDVRIVRNGLLALQDRDAANNVLREYSWGLNLGGGIGGLLNLRQSGTDYSYLFDGKGNVGVVLDNTQAVVASYRYNAFGKVVAQAGTLEQPFRFSTKRYDAGTGLNYYGYRFYAPAIERWIYRDPLGEAGGINLYGFVGNDPVNWIDPWGLIRITGVGNEPIYVHPNDVDPRPSRPHGHVGSPNSSTKVDVNTGKIYRGTLDTGKKLTKKQLQTLRDILRGRGLLNVPLLILPPGLSYCAENPLKCMDPNFNPYVVTG